MTRPGRAGADRAIHRDPAATQACVRVVTAVVESTVASHVVTAGHERRACVGMCGLRCGARSRACGLRGGPSNLRLCRRRAQHGRAVVEVVHSAAERERTALVWNWALCMCACATRCALLVCIRALRMCRVGRRRAPRVGAGRSLVGLWGETRESERAASESGESGGRSEERRSERAWRGVREVIVVVVHRLVPSYEIPTSSGWLAGYQLYQPAPTDRAAGGGALVGPSHPACPSAAPCATSSG